MNFIAFTNRVQFERATTELILVPTPHYIIDEIDSRVYSDEIEAISDILHSVGIHAFSVEENGELSDSEKDMNDDRATIPGEDMDGDFDSGMASAGYGTDEDYGDFGGDGD